MQCSQSKGYMTAEVVGSCVDTCNDSCIESYISCCSGNVVWLLMAVEKLNSLQVSVQCNLSAAGILCTKHISASISIYINACRVLVAGAITCWVSSVFSHFLVVFQLFWENVCISFEIFYNELSEVNVHKWTKLKGDRFFFCVKNNIFVIVSENFKRMCQIFF